MLTIKIVLNYFFILIPNIPPTPPPAAAKSIISPFEPLTLNQLPAIPSNTNNIAPYTSPANIPHNIPLAFAHLAQSNPAIPADITVQQSAVKGIFSSVISV